MPLPDFDVREIPFSRRGSWLDLSPVIALHTIVEHVHLVSHQTGMHPILRLEPLGADGLTAAAELTADAATLTWTTADGRVDAVFSTTDTVRLRGAGAGMRLSDAAPGLTPFTGTYLFVDPIDGAAVMTSYETGRRYALTLLAGEWSVTGDQLLGEGDRWITVTPDGSGAWELSVQEYQTVRAARPAPASFDDVVAELTQEFERYLADIAGWRDDSTPAAALAAYVLWSATVSPLGFLGRESILMSKHWMDKVWTWDHCFNALALAGGLPDEALDQFLVVFDHQDDAGGLPDSITHSEILTNYVKPPIHGWAFAKLRARLPRALSSDEVAEAYDRLSRWTLFWLDARRVPGHVLPHYQHGNDSGWDNSTIFDRDRVLESPDLAAFLLVQLDLLSDLARELDQDATRWQSERADLREALLDQLWDGETFTGVSPTTGRRSSASSLLNLMPIAAGDRLPAEVITELADGIRAHLTEWGPATEHPDSEHYEDDGYWRGPIWAPSTVLIEDGLRRAGEVELADEVSARFRRLCERSGFAENFDAKTGAGLRDRAYTWTASAYLLLAAEARERDAS